MNENLRHLIVALLIGALHLGGIASAIHALLSKRSSQSAIAWTISCITLPYIAVPAYWILGASRFHGSVRARQASNAQLQALRASLRRCGPAQPTFSDELQPSCRVFEALAGVPFTGSNRVRLLIDGSASFDAILQQIGQANDYVLVQFFIVRDDDLGRRFRDALAERVREGVRVFFMYDRIGCHALPRSYANSLRDAGIQVRAFQKGRGLSNRFQINFRNHRKLVVVDGRWAATGGANLGEEYRGHSERFGDWRDTMVAVQGPAVQEIQGCFAEDWFFLSNEMPQLNRQPAEAPHGRHSVLVLPTGPADSLHACSMMFVQAILTARDRVWITTPYFVPDAEIVRALQLAALRGVDVRILLPDNPNHWLVYWASFTYMEDLEKTGVRFFRYTRGLLHQKTVLVDATLSLLGTANMDNRSFYLNFELTVLVAHAGFAREVASMLEQDFRASRPAGSDDFRARSPTFRLAARLARLLSPVL